MRNGETGFLANSTAEWREALEHLYLDQGLRMKMGAAGKQIARERFSRDVVKFEYRTVLFEIGE
jgi:glycosyltransferase involved in cell wall biosynthesis